LFENTLPLFATQGIISKSGKIWIPNLSCTSELLENYSASLSPYYTWHLAEDAKSNPLYLATEDVEEELLQCPDSLTNETQIRPFLNYSKFPFYVLQLKDAFSLPSSVTPSSKKSKREISKIDIEPISLGKILVDENEALPTKKTRKVKR
jgi:hypothetical protein